MKKINKAFVEFSAALLVIAIAFTACGKDEDAKEGKRAGEEYCRCFVVAENEMKNTGWHCIFPIEVKYGASSFDNKAFAKAFAEAAKICNPDFGSEK